MEILMGDIGPGVSVIEPDQFEVHMQLGDIYKNKKMYQEDLKSYRSVCAIIENGPYIHRSVLEIYKTLFLLIK